MKKLALLLAFLLTAGPALAADSVFDKVMASGTLRCGYYVFPPMTKRDPNTGALSGFSVDMMEELASRAGLKVEWAEEVTFGNWVPALQAKRFDAVCTPMWPEIPMARAVAFTDPVLYSGLSPLIRADDSRVKGDDLDALNKPEIIFLTQEGNAIDGLTRKGFPQAEVRAMPPSMEGPVMMQEIVTGKADAILLDRNALREYNKNNPVPLRMVAADRPVKVQSFSLVVPRQEMILKDFLDNAIHELQNDGTIDRLLIQWEEEPGLFLRAGKNYEVRP